jgi:hypothetical protein
MEALRRLEKQFGKPHPELQGVRPLPAQLVWLVDAFLRLHRRRDYHAHTGNPLPLGHTQIADFAERTLRLPRDLSQFLSRAMESIDDGVLDDHYAKQKNETGNRGQ